MKLVLSAALVAVMLLTSGCVAPPASAAPVNVAPQKSTQAFLDAARIIHGRFADMPAGDLVDAGHKLCEGIEKYGLDDYRAFISENAADDASRKAFDRLIFAASKSLC